jgi:predicted DsbA family dithiol-disulfide isomerase
MEKQKTQKMFRKAYDAAKKGARRLLLGVALYAAGAGSSACGGKLGLVEPPMDSGMRTDEPDATCQRKIGLGSLPFWGESPDPAEVVIFGDFQDPYTGKLYSDVEQKIRQNQKYMAGNVDIFWRDFPLSAHANAEAAAEAGRCAAEQGGGFWTMHDALLVNQSRWAPLAPKDLQAALNGIAQSANFDVARFESCVLSRKHSAAIQQDLSDGTSYGVNGTPYVFILLPKGRGIDLNAIKALPGLGSDGSAPKLDEDCRFHIVAIPGAYPYSYFSTVLDAMK